jgi:hypothetical protein
MKTIVLDENREVTKTITAWKTVTNPSTGKETKTPFLFHTLGYTKLDFVLENQEDSEQLHVIEVDITAGDENQVVVTIPFADNDIQEGRYNGEVNIRGTAKAPKKIDTFTAIVRRALKQYGVSEV